MVQLPLSFPFSLAFLGLTWCISSVHFLNSQITSPSHKWKYCGLLCTVQEGVMFTAQVGQALQLQQLVSF